MVTSRRGITKFLAKYRETGSVDWRSVSGRPSKLTGEVKVFVEEQMRRDDETIAHQLHQRLCNRRYSSLHCRTSLGWTFSGSSHCQLIQEPNRVKWLEWARKHINNDFDDVIWTDECSVQLQTHRHFYCRKRGEVPMSKPRCVNLLLLLTL